MILYICTGGMHLHLRLYSKLILETMILKYIRIPLEIFIKFSTLDICVVPNGVINISNNDIKTNTQRHMNVYFMRMAILISAGNPKFKNNW